VRNLAEVFAKHSVTAERISLGLVIAGAAPNDRRPGAERQVARS
jgi:hypothetical protein